MKNLDIFKGVGDNGQEIKLHSCLRCFSISAGYYDIPSIKLPISEIEETLFCRMPIEKSASADGLENLLFSERFLRVTKRVSVDGMLIEIGTKDVPLSMFQTVRWLVANMGKTVISENLNVEISKRRFGLWRHERYKTSDYNTAEKREAVSYNTADAWARAHCNKSAEELVVWLNKRVAAIPSGTSMQLKSNI